MNTRKAIMITCLAGFLISSCKKYLEKSPDIKLAIPKTVADLQGILNWDAITQSGQGLPDVGCDDYYLKPNDFLAVRTEVVRNAHTWERDIFKGATAGEWNTPYDRIYRCNVVLDGLTTISPSTGAPGDWEFAKGHALFCRAFFLYGLSETFGFPFKPASAATDWGIPLPTTSALDNPVTRASVQEVFNQIVADLSEATGLLPDQPDLLHRNRPSKASAHALLARVYLTMQNYDKAYENADKSLSYYSVLTKYDSSAFVATSNRPFTGFPNEIREVTYNCSQLNYGLFNLSTVNIDTVLFASYDTNDRRRVLYFAPNGASRFFKGQYTGGTGSFYGLATDEVYLIKAECLARQGNTNASMDALNTLLRKRWIESRFTPLTAPDADSALRIVLNERRKELIFRGVRWSDLRRLNQDTRFQKTLVRVLGSRVVSLPPNHPNYVYPIPDNELQRSGIPQNPRVDL